MLQRDSGHDYFSFDINEERDYYKINSDEMVQNSNGLENLVRGMDQENTDLETLPSQNESKTGYKYVETQCSDTPNTCVDTLDATEKKNTDDYIHASEYPVYASTLTRIFSPESNELNAAPHVPGSVPAPGNIPTGRHIEVSNMKETASVTESVDTTSELSVSSGSSIVTRRPVSELDRLSGSSDEVFTDCPDCLKTTGRGHLVRACSQCQKTRIELPIFDLHFTERNDSAISSATSDDLKSDHGNPSDTSVSSSEESIFMIANSDGLPVRNTRDKLYIKKTPSTKYYDEASISEMIKTYPAWTCNSNPTADFRIYEKMPDIDADINSEKDIHQIQNSNLFDEKLKPVPDAWSRRYLFDDPYYKVHLHFGCEEIWNIAETKM